MRSLDQYLNKNVNFGDSSGRVLEEQTHSVQSHEFFLLLFFKIYFCFYFVSF